MKAVILAGGFGTRMSEETGLRPKPLVEIGEFPVLWHIMKIYAAHGITEFVICLGYKGEMIKDYFTRHYQRINDLTYDMGRNEITYHQTVTEDWKVSLINTGADALTGGRIAAVADHLSDDEPFCMTYGDGVGNVDITSLIAFHKAQGRKATVTAVTPPGRFGVLDIAGERVTGFREKIAADQYKINAGFFVLEKSALAYIDGPQSTWEQEPMINLAAEGELAAFQHNGFWQPMDTLRDKNTLNKLWASGKAPWKVW